MPPHAHDAQPPDPPSVSDCSWSGYGWTKFVLAAVIVVADLLSGLAALYAGRERFVPSVVNHLSDPRSILLQLAAWGFGLGAAEVGTHLLIAQIGAEFGGEFFMGLILVLIIGQLGPYALTIAVWRAHLNPEPSCSASPYWAPLELAAGTSFYFLFGAGLIVGPSALAADSIARMVQALGAYDNDRAREDEIALQEL